MRAAAREPKRNRAEYPAGVTLHDRGAEQSEVPGPKERRARQVLADAFGADDEQRYERADSRFAGAQAGQRVKRHQSVVDAGEPAQALLTDDGRGQHRSGDARRRNGREQPEPPPETHRRKSRVEQEKRGGIEEQMIP